MAGTGREDVKNNQDVETLRDDPQSSSTLPPATSSPHNSPEHDGDSANGLRSSNTPHETSTPVIHGSSAPPRDSPTSEGDEDRSAVIAPPATMMQKAMGSVTMIWGSLCFLWKINVIPVICTMGYAYLFYNFFPVKQDAISTMTYFLVLNWILHSLYKNMSSIFLMTIAILWLLWLVYAILVHLIIVEVVRSIYLTSTKARLWLLVLQTLKVMFVDFAIFIGSILRVPFDYIRFIAHRQINGLISRFGQGPPQSQLLPEDMLVPT